MRLVESGEPTPERQSMPSALPSFAQIFEDNARFVWRALLGLGILERDVQDASQQVFLVLYRRIHDFDQTCTLRTFIYGICLRVASEQRRRQARSRDRYMEELPEPMVAPSQVRSVATRQALERLEHVLERLPQAQRDVFVLFEVEELSMAEIASAVGCPLFTAYARLRSARRAIAVEFNEAWIEGDEGDEGFGEEP